MAATRSNTTLPMLVAGAGLSGLSLAALLTHKWIPFILLETSSSSEEARDNCIKLQRWAYEPLIQALVEEDNPRDVVEAFKRCVAVGAQVGGVGRVETCVIDAVSGESLGDAGSGANDASRECFCANSGRLRDWLLQKIGQADIRRNAEVKDVMTDDDGVLAAVLRDGEEMRGSYQVAADGVHSTGQPKEQTSSWRG